MCSKSNKDTIVAPRRPEFLVNFGQEGAVAQGRGGRRRCGVAAEDRDERREQDDRHGRRPTMRRHVECPDTARCGAALLLVLFV